MIIDDKGLADLFSPWGSLDTTINDAGMLARRFALDGFVARLARLGSELSLTMDIAGILGNSSIHLGHSSVVNSQRGLLPEFPLPGPRFVVTISHEGIFICWWCFLDRWDRRFRALPTGLRAATKTLLSLGFLVLNNLTGGRASRLTLSGR